MARTPCTHFNPALGVKYIMVDVETGEKVTCRVLLPKEKHFHPIRSPRNSQRGEEFFKVMMPNGEVVKVMNSLKRERVLTEDGKYEFIGMRPNGQSLPRSTEKVKGVSIENLEGIETEVSEPEETLEDIVDEEEVSNLSILE